VAQFSTEILDNYVVPNLSKLNRCGSSPLKRPPNYFREFLLRSAFGKKKFKPTAHALLTVFFRRTDFACVEYGLGHRRLAKYCRGLPDDNSETRVLRLSLSHFETCLIHAEAAIRAMIAMLHQLEAEVPEYPEYNRIRLLANRVRHFDEDTEKEAKRGGRPAISPIWISDTGLHCKQSSITFPELKSVLVAAIRDSKNFAEMLK
jgi:hypothetical protein